MKPRSLSPGRRGFLGAVLVGVAMPRLAFAQAAQPLAAEEQETIMQIRIAFGGQQFTASLHDNPSARDLASMLPLDLSIDDYATNENPSATRPPATSATTPPGAISPFSTPATAGRAG
jgi:hypothetical protein